MGNFPIIVDHKIYNDYVPEVRGLQYCGGYGLFMHLTPEFLSNKHRMSLGDRGRTIVHEWAHLRYGVLDEYPSIQKANKTLNFYSVEGTWKPVRCTNDIKGSLLTDCSDESTKCRRSSTGFPEENCIFCPSDSNTAKASLMGYNFLNNLEEFCDIDDPSTPSARRHNSNADNLQNKYCNGQSIWEILRKNIDINATIPGSPQMNTDPTFRVFKQQSALVVVFVLDVSGSMKGKLLQNLRKAADSYISDTANDKTWVGIVEFSSVAYICHNITRVTSTTVRKSLVNALPTSASGQTSIGAGLEKAYQMIKKHGRNITGATILLATDGKENTRPYIKDMKPYIISEDIRVNALAITDKADPKIEKLARDTDGSSSFYPGSDNPSLMNNAFDNLVPPDEVSVQISSSAVSITKGEDQRIEFYVDASMSRDVKVRISVSESNVSVMTSIQTPTGKMMYRPSFKDNTGSIKTFHLKGRNEPGMYLIRLSTNSTDVISGGVQVTSKMSGGMASHRTKRMATMQMAVDVTGWLSNDIFRISHMQKISVHASILKGYAAIIYGNVSAWIDDGRGNETILPLKDDGIASSYDVRIADSPQMLRRNPDTAKKVPMTTSPKPAGEIETLAIKPEAQNMTYYIGIRGIDDKDNYGDMSNIISLSVITDPQWTGYTDTGSGYVDKESDYTGNGSGLAGNGSGYADFGSGYADIESSYADNGSGYAGDGSGNADNGSANAGDVSKFISRNGHIRSREAPSGIKIEVSIDEAIIALRRKDNGRKKDVITHGIMTVMH
ncbi:hypothetical protein FSP39_001599 [Pinctada imbricata]|uniref:VWFA domain-containing protein n=1 Tax=Pinctada imbricata TaxID=66713 RepID=A0AA88YFC4_PINIB|nr:hypothetical protein FSP39_001599 [Pinctada imbricata]